MVFSDMADTPQETVILIVLYGMLISEGLNGDEIFTLGVLVNLLSHALLTLGLLTIDLIATMEKYRGRGIAERMIRYAEGHCHGFDTIKVGTQIANMPSLKLYERMGFRISDSQYVFHYHHGEKIKL